MKIFDIDGRIDKLTAKIAATEALAAGMPLHLAEQAARGLPVLRKELAALREVKRKAEATLDG